MNGSVARGKTLLITIGLGDGLEFGKRQPVTKVQY